MDMQREVLVLGIGNLLWADEGFGVRAVEALNQRYRFPDGVELMDGGTLGLSLLPYIETSRRVLVFDAVDFGLAPGEVKVLRDGEVPKWGARKMSPHQNGFNDVLALAHLHGCAPVQIAAIGVQPHTLDDFGGSLTDCVRARLDDAIALAADEIARWGLAGELRGIDEAVDPLNDQAVALSIYENERPAVEAACRVGDPRLLAMRQRAEG
jgi:hydrogenase maturation protease